MSEHDKIKQTMENAGVSWAFMEDTRDLVVGCTGPNRSGFVTIQRIPDDVVLKRAIYIMQRESSARDANIEQAKQMESDGLRRLRLGEGLKAAAVEDKERSEKAIYGLRLYLTDGKTWPEPEKNSMNELTLKHSTTNL